MTLKANQAALVLTIDDEGEVAVEVATVDKAGLAGAICDAIAMKLTEDEEFQEELMDILNSEEE
ncbi:MAG: twitching motility protein [Desulfobulbus propionicus]|nr:MAG: twitching motility protein [Desulfobulbus propionicus]